MFDALAGVARSFGNVAHLPYLRSPGRRELLIVDGWSNRAGADRVMASPDLERELAPLWTPLPEIAFWEPSGWAGKDECGVVPPHRGAVVLVRGPVREGDEARAAHDRLFAALAPVASDLGHVAHLPCLSSTAGDELLVIDVWENVAGAERVMSDPRLPGAFAGFFAVPPEVTTWEAVPWPAYDESRGGTRPSI